MLKVPFAAMLAAISSVATAQTLTTTFANNNGGSAGGAVYFDLAASAATVVTGIDLHFNTAAGTASSVEILTVPVTRVGNEQNAAAWTSLTIDPVVSGGIGVPSPVTLTNPLVLASGTSVGIAIRTVGATLLAHAYTTGGTGFPLTYTGCGLSLTAGGASNVPFTGAPFSPRVVNCTLHYTSSAACGTKTTYGNGCYKGERSFYENFAAGAFDFTAGTAGAEQVIHMSNLGATGWLVAPGAPAWFTPAAATANVLTAAAAAMGDDSVSGPLALGAPFPTPAGPINAVHATSNGYIHLATTALTTSDFSPTVAELLNTANLPRVCSCWTDLHAGTNLTTNPASGMYFDVDPTNPNLSYITYNDCAVFGALAGASSINMQVVLDSSTGDIEIRYRSMVGVTGPVIVGHSLGQVGGINAADPGNRDISATMPFSTTGPDRNPLRLDVSGLLQIGSTPTFNTTNIPSTVSLSILFGSFVQLSPGVDLGFLGAAGCDLNLAAVPAPTLLAIDFATSNPTWAYSSPTFFTSPLWIGVTFNFQTASLVPGVNSLGVLTSNGLQVTF